MGKCIFAIYNDLESRSSTLFQESRCVEYLKLRATALAAELDDKTRKLVTMMIAAVKIVQHGFLFISC